MNTCEECGKSHDGSYGSGRFCSSHCRYVYAAKIGNEKQRISGTLTNKMNKVRNCRIATNKTIQFTCPHCKKEFYLSVGERMNHIRWCEHNPKRQQYIAEMKARAGKPAWNKGLTKETNKGVAKRAITIREKYKRGELTPTFLGRHHSEETKRKMSSVRRGLTYQRICKKTQPYVKKDGTVVNLDSSYERQVAKFLDDNNIEWSRPEPLEWFDQQGNKHHYFPDFYIPSKNLYLDPKNEYCFEAQAEKIAYVQEHYNNVIFLHETDLDDDNLRTLLLAN